MSTQHTGNDTTPTPTAPRTITTTARMLQAVTATADRPHGRLALDAVRILPNGGAEATDGTWIARVQPLDADNKPRQAQPDASAGILVDAGTVQAAIKAAGRSGLVSVRQAADTDAPIVTVGAAHITGRAPEIDYYYPETDRYRRIGDDPAGRIVVRLDGQILRKLIDLCAKQTRPGSVLNLAFTIPKPADYSSDVDSAIRVDFTADGAQVDAVIMPIRP